MLGLDVFIIGRRPHEPSMKEAGIFIGVFVGLAILFGLGDLGGVRCPKYAGEFFAGWLTEYSLSIDNLFIFIIIMTQAEGAPAAAAVRPAGRHHPGAGLPRASSSPSARRRSTGSRWIFFLFGAFLIYTAVKLVIDYRSHDDDGDDMPDNAADAVRQAAVARPPTSSTAPS